MRTPIDYTDVTTITSFGSTGVFFNNNIIETLDVDDLNRITCDLQAQGYDYEVTNPHEGEEDMPQDEWVITIK